MRDVFLFLFCFVGSIGLGWLTARDAKPDKPVWPALLYNFLAFEMSNIPWVRKIGEDKKEYTRREQLMASCFVWFFILFVPCVFIFGCPKSGCPT